MLMLGNLEFKETKPDEAAVTKETRKQLGVAAKLFQLDQAQLAHKLVTRDIKVSGYGTFRLNFHRFDRFELDLLGLTRP